jgi:hypothetical protein
MHRCRRIVSVLLITGFVGTFGTGVCRAVEPTTAGEWATLIDRAESTFTPPPADDLARRRQELVTVVGRIQRALRSFDEASRAAWETYFHTSSIEACLERAPEVQLAVMEMVRESLTADVEGLEADEVVALRTAVKNYAAALKRNTGDLQARYLDNIQALRGDLRLLSAADRMADDKRVAAEHRISLTLAALEEAGQAAELIAEVRRHWAYPNAVIRVNTGFVSKYVERNINETSMQRATVLGTQTRGPSQTFGKLELVSLENPNQMQVQLRMAGNTRSGSNVGTNGPAVIYSSSTSNFDAHKSLYFDPYKGLTAAPADTRVNASIGIKKIDIDPPALTGFLKPVFTRAAWSKAKEQQGAAELEVARLIGRRIEQRLDDEMVDPLKKAQDYYKLYMIQRPLRIDEVPMVGSRSTSEHIELLIKQARPAQFAAAGPPPEFDSATSVGVAIHQSVFNNGSARVVWGGAEVTDEDVEHYSQVATMHVPPALRVFSSSKPWSVTLDVDHPTTMIFEDGAIDLTIHTVGWKIGDVRFERKIDLRVKYGVANSRLGMTFTRQGDYRIVAVDGRPWTTEEQATLIPHIDEKCAAFMQEQGRFNSLILPKGDGFGPLGTIDLKQLECRDGWLVIGYQSLPKEPAVLEAAAPTSQR